MKRWEELVQAYGVRKQVGVSILIPGKTDFKLKQMRIYKEHVILIMGTICQEDIKLLSMSAPNCGTPNFISNNKKQNPILLDLISSTSEIAGDLNTQLSPTERLPGQKTNRNL